MPLFTPRTESAPVSAVARGLVALFVLAAGALEGAEPAPAFLRGLNLHGPAVVIDGRAWEGADSAHYRCDDRAFENQAVELVPPTDPERARMIRSSRFGGNRVELIDLPAGPLSLFLYVWEDNQSETFSIAVNGQVVAPRVESGPAGHWQKLGPWPVTAPGGRLVLTSRGGAANFSGIEIWTGHVPDPAEALSEADVADFERRVRPLLVARCYECHSATARELGGELLVDSRAALRRGGASGPALVPGQPEKSLLIEAVRYRSPDLRMPPDGRLTDEEIGILEDWVRRGAPDPRSTATRAPEKKLDVAAARAFWSLRPLSSPPLPAVRDSDWPAVPLDRFILARLDAEGLVPAPEASRRVLLRRVTYDLTGLPPSPEEIADFLADSSPEAYAHVVDRLLASPRYGERWGRHWLDVVRYADTAGDNSDYPVPQMVRYRDWVIDAFNRDLPYDEFVRDQLAGDLRGAGVTDEQHAERIIATGYLAAARRFGSRVDDYPQHLTIEDTLDNIGRSFLGLSLSCARCHDHKFDPVTNRDYYALYGILASTRYPWPGIELDKQPRDLVPLVPPAQRDEALEQLARRQSDQARLDKSVARLKATLKETADEPGRARLKTELAAAEEAARRHAETNLPFELAYAVSDLPEPRDAAVQLKGDPARPGDIVPRRFLEVLGGEPLPHPEAGSGRAELAEWILAPQNPLAARVMANRIWQQHFGRGLVPTPMISGGRGSPPRIRNCSIILPSRSGTAAGPSRRSTGRSSSRAPTGSRPGGHRKPSRRIRPRRSSPVFRGGAWKRKRFATRSWGLENRSITRGPARIPSRRPTPGTLPSTIRSRPCMSRRTAASI